MKRNFLRLCLMLGLLSLNSCRQDIIPEPEAYNNSGAFQLKSNRISLNEAKHKAKLVSELEQVETKFKAKSSAFGKIVNYGNGVSIDTDDVTYIENGPNYHTYTFNIKRENAPANAPVENLVLSPLTDGTYRELLVTYNFTPQEKQTLMNGGFVDTKGKATITELASGTYSGALAKTSCSYETVTINIPCTSKEHHMPGQSCDMTGNDAPRSFTMVALVCGADTSLGDDGSPGGGVSIGPIGGLGNGEDDGSGNTDFPSNEPGNNCNGGLTAPQTPGYDISDGGCGGSIPTQPTLPTKSKTPCEKIKALVNNAELKIKIDSLKKFSLTAEENEKGYQQDKTGNVTPALVNGAHYVDFIIGQNSLGGIHCHTLNGTHMFSPKDILTFLSFAEVQNQTLPIGSTADNTGNAFLGMISQSSSYFITFNGGSGDLPPPMTDAEEDALEIKMNEAYRNIKKDLLKAEGKSKGDTLSQQGLQKLFFEMIKKMGLEGKINLIQQDGSNTSTIQQNSDGTIKTPTPC